MKTQLVIMVLLGVITESAFAQARSELSLTNAYARIAENYPLLENVALTKAAYRAEINQLKAARKPSVQLKADARIQSEQPQIEGNEQLPLELDLPLYSASSYLEANFQLYDGGRNRAQREVQKAQRAVDLQSLATERYTLRERTNRLFVNIILNRQQANVLETTLADLRARRQALEAGREYGTVLPSDVDQLRVNELEIQAQRSDRKYANRGLLATLAKLTGEPLNTATILILPPLPDPAVIPDLTRPERQLLQQQRRALLTNEALISAELRPTIGLFAQGGVGYPNPLNFFDNQASPYGIAGINFQWNLINWKKQKHQRESLALRAQQIAQQEKTLVFNSDAQTNEYLADVARLRNQISNDEAIVALQANVLKQLAAQLVGGVITSTDYLTQSNAELRARQQLQLHRIQLVQTQLEFLTNRGVDDLTSAASSPPN